MAKSIGGCRAFPVARSHRVAHWIVLVLVLFLVLVVSIAIAIDAGARVFERREFA